LVAALHGPPPPRLITTGNGEIDKKVGGGLPEGSLTLIEGQSDAGKSVLTQQLIWGSLQNGFQVAVYTTENTTASFLRQMASLSLEVTDFFLLRRLDIYTVPNTFSEEDSSEIFHRLLDHVARNQTRDLFVVDSLTALIAHASESQTLDFFSSAKEICDQEKTLIMTVHSYALDEQLLARLRSICDAHMRLRVEEVGSQLVKVLEVSKVRGASKTTGNIISFDVEPGLGMRIIPITKAKA
jgi:archaeal flagellar protein FlaH